MYEPKLLNGYRLVYNPTYPKALKKSGYRGYVYEHILVAETYLKRPLLPLEDVHHLDGNRSNNSIDNLLVLSHKMHGKLHSWLNTVTITKISDKPQTPSYCLTCGKILIRKGTLYCCGFCARHNPTNIKRPPLEELKDLYIVQKLSKSAIGRKYGVSCNAVIKWLKLYKITDG